MPLIHASRIMLKPDIDLLMYAICLPSKQKIDDDDDDNNGYDANV